MVQQYGAGVAEALAKRREEVAMEALSATNRLSRFSPFICVYSLGSFIAWAALWHFSSAACSAPVLSPDEDQAFRSLCFAFSGAFAASFIFQLMQLFDSSVKGSLRSAPVYVTAVINLVSFLTYLAMANGIFPVILSSAGRMSHVIRWGQWIAIAPVLIVMMHSLDVRNESDMTFLNVSVVVQIAAIVSGFYASYVKSRQVANVLLVVQGLCNCQIIYILLRSMHRYRLVKNSMAGSFEEKSSQSPLQQMIASKLQSKGRLSAQYTPLPDKASSAQPKEGSEDILAAVKNVGVIIAFKLAVYCCITWLLMLAITTMGLLGRLSHFQEAVLHSILDIVDKCLYVKVLCSGHGTAVSPEGLLTRMLILEERANASIRLVSACDIFRMIKSTIFIVYAFHLPRGV